MILLYLLYSIVFCAALALPVREYILTGTLTSAALVRSGALLLIGVLGLLRTRRADRKQRLGRRAQYQTDFAAYIGNIFPENEAARNRFFDAVDCYARKNPAGGWKRLEKLLPLCKTPEERYAVSVFSGFCLHNLEKYESALEHYREALAINQDSTVASNMGVCYEKLGLVDFATRYYHIAILSNPDNPLPHSNLAQIWIAAGDYAKAETYASQALARKPDLLPALTAMAVCRSKQGRQAEYEAYLQKAAAAGGKPEKIKAYIQALT